MLKTNEIDSRVIDKSIDILTQQSVVPDSPGSLDSSGDNLNLCLAAIVAKAGLLVANEQKRLQKFEQDILSQGLKDRIEAEFIFLGWSTKLCREQIMFNDNTPFSTRKQNLMNYLHKCQN